jgi:hypothetical protein
MRVRIERSGSRSKSGSGSGSRLDPTLLGLVAVALLSFVPRPSLAAPPEPAASSTTEVAPPPTPVLAAPPPPVLPPPSEPPAPPVVLAPPSEPFVRRSTVALYAAGIAVAGASAATVFGVLALQNKRDYQRSPTYSNSDQGNNDAAYADGAIALAVAAGVTSIVLFLTTDSASGRDPTATASKVRSVVLSASPFVTAHGGGAGAVLSF